MPRIKPILTTLVLALGLLACESTTNTEPDLAEETTAEPVHVEPDDLNVQATDLPDDAEPVECQGVFCCELYDVSYTGLGSGRQCHSVNAPGACKHKFTCTTGCYNGAGKINTSTGGYNTGCS